ncbi:hypothetical protein [Methylobacterium sp. CM6257]
MDLSDLEFWAFLAVAVFGLFLPVAITGWKGRAIVPVALLSLVFWPGALILALRLRHRRDL